MLMQQIMKTTFARINRWQRAGLIAVLGIAVATPVSAQLVGAEPALGERITQAMVEDENSIRKLRKEGLRIFSTPFNTLDGLGDGPMNQPDKIAPGGRPGVQSSDQIFLRLNGLDSQTCLECHNILSNREIPATNAVGGAGGASQSAFPAIIDPDIDDSENNGFARIEGRMINPPFSFGSGGIELLAKEMTSDLQDLLDVATANPGAVISLDTHGVNFGTITFDGIAFDLSSLEGVDDDLVVRPFGRKGCCQTVRQFDVGAMQFHHGIQPVEAVGAGVDDDGDGVVDELTIGELSALHIFQVALKPPRETQRDAEELAGETLFADIGCADCHIPQLVTDDHRLPLSFPEVETDPSQNIYKHVNLRRPNPGFRRSGQGVIVPLYADLKRHDMGPDLAETTGSPLDPLFHTARLWGVADTAPYLHDGRATTLVEAIDQHGGEAQGSRDIFDALSDPEKEALIEFLKTLRTPRHPNKDID